MSDLKAQIEHVLYRELLVQFVELGKHIPEHEWSKHDLVSARFSVQQLHEALVCALMPTVTAETARLTAEVTRLTTALATEQRLRDEDGHNHINEMVRWQEERTRLTTERDGWQIVADSEHAEVTRLTSQVATLKETLERVMESLNYYAHPEHGWSEGEHADAYEAGKAALKLPPVDAPTTPAPKEQPCLGRSDRRNRSQGWRST